MGEVPYGINPATQAPLYSGIATCHSDAFIPAKSSPLIGIGLATSRRSPSPSPDTDDADQPVGFSFAPASNWPCFVCTAAFRKWISLNSTASALIDGSTIRSAAGGEVARDTRVESITTPIGFVT